MEDRIYHIRARRIDGDNYRPDMKLIGTIDEIKGFLIEKKFSHVSQSWVPWENKITIDKIDHRLLKEYSSRDDMCLYLFYGYIDELKEQFERLADNSHQPCSLWPVRAKLYVVKIDIFRLNFWIGSDPLYGVIGIPIDDKFVFLQGLISYLQTFPSGIGARETRKAVEDFYEKNGLPRDYYHEGCEKPDTIKYYSEH